MTQGKKWRVLKESIDIILMLIVLYILIFHNPKCEGKIYGCECPPFMTDEYWANFTSTPNISVGETAHSTNPAELRHSGLSPTSQGE